MVLQAPLLQQPGTYLQMARKEHSIGLFSENKSQWLYSPVARTWFISDMISFVSEPLCSVYEYMTAN